jgi:hypothetical protein
LPTGQGVRLPERPTTSTWPRASQITTSPYLKTGVRYGPNSKPCRSASATGMGSASPGRRVCPTAATSRQRFSIARVPLRAIMGYPLHAPDAHLEKDKTTPDCSPNRTRTILSACGGNAVLSGG